MSMGKTKSYEVGFSPKELEDFRKIIIAKKSPEQFIQAYLEKHKEDNVSNYLDVFSLILNAAISLKNNYIVEYLLKEGVKYISKSGFDNGILANVDITDFSPFSSAMYSMNEEILKLIKEYIDNNSIIKSDIPSQDYQHIKRILEIPGFNMDSDYCLEEFLQHIYTPESLNVLIDDINQDF